MRRKNFGYVGAMEICFDLGSNAFTTRALYKKYENEKWDVEGALYPINKDVFMIVSIDRIDDTIQTTYINRRGADYNGNVLYFAG